MPKILLLITHNNYLQQKYVHNLKLILHILINLKLIFKSCSQIALDIKEIILDWILLLIQSRIIYMWFIKLMWFIDTINMWFIKIEFL